MTESLQIFTGLSYCKIHLAFLQARIKGRKMKSETMTGKPMIEKNTRKRNDEKREAWHCFELAPRHRFLELLQNNIAERLAGRMGRKSGRTG